MSLESFSQRKKKPDIKRSADGKHISKEYMTEEDRQYLAKEIARERNLTVTNRVIGLSYKRALHKGLIVLGRVSKVKKYQLVVSLPRFEGYVKDVDVSQSYKRLLQGTTSKEIFQNEYYPLSDLFKPGDYVVCCIKDIHEIDLDCIYLSMEPQLINQNVRPNNLVKGFKIIGSVKSIEDHGYIVDTGIFNVTAFLATENVEKGKQYLPNTQLLCTVKEVETVGHTTVIKLSTKKKKLVKVDDHDVVSLDVLMPGTKFLLRIKTVLCNSLQVYFGKDENTEAYIHRTNLKHPLSTYKSDTNVTVTLLYTTPMMGKKRAFFSELDDTFLEMGKLHVGDIIEEAKVLYREALGVILKLSESGLRGYVAFHRTRVPVDKIETVFKEGSIHKCRVLGYNWMDHFYICTTEEEVLKEKFFSLFDVNIGDIITVTIDGFTSSSIFVTFGEYLYGTVSKILHLSDNGLHGLRLKKCDKVEAKVLNHNPVEFTLKQSLIKSKLPVLKDFSEAKCGSRYHGTITIINKKGLWVRFYGTVKGLVPHTTLNSDWKWKFFVGQTVQVCVTLVDENLQKMKLKIVTDEEEQQSVNLSIGEFVKGIVTESSVEGVYMKIQKEGSENIVTGFLPAGHLAPCIDVGKSLALSCTPGTVISASVFATKPTLIMSCTLVMNETICFDSLKVGDCIPCTVREISNDGVKVISPIENYSKLIFIPHKDMCNFSHMHTYTILIAKITAINKRERELTLTTSLKAWESPSEYKPKKLMDGMGTLILYLRQIAELGKFNKNKPISSVTLGQRVTATVEQVTENGLVLRINDHLKGVARTDHYLGNPKEGDKVFATILWKNYVRNIVEVSLLPTIINCISPKQDLLPDLPVSVWLRAEILLVTKCFVLLVVKYNGMGYLAVMPARRHINDTVPDLTSFKVHADIQVYVVLQRRKCNIPTCMIKSAFKLRHFVTEPSAKNKQELKRKRVSESHDVDLANPSKKVSKKVPKKALEKENEKKSEVKEKESRIKDIDEYSESDEGETEDEIMFH